jgi:Protein kinase domain
MIHDDQNLSQINQEFLEVLSRLKQHSHLLDDLAHLKQQFQQFAETGQAAMTSTTHQTPPEPSLPYSDLLELANQVKQLKLEQSQVQTHLTSLHSQLQELDRERLIFLNQIDRFYGQTVEKYHQRLQSLSLDERIKWSARILLQTCAVLKSLHDSNPVVIHSNIQPSTILFRESDKRVFLIGMPINNPQNLSKDIRIFQNYKAPEQANGQLVPQSDIYAVGVTLIYLVTGKKLQEFQDQNRLNQDFNLENIPIPTPLKEVISRATQYQVSDRYQTIKELMEPLRVSAL